MKIWKPLFVIAAILFMACKNEQVPKDPTDDIKLKWEAFIAHWEMEAAKELKEYYTVDGINIPNEFKANKGRAEIEAFYNFLFENNLSSTYKHDIISLDYSDSLAVERGKFEVNWIRNDSSQWTYKARTVTHWVKEKDGEWRIKLFLFNKPPETTIDE